MLYREKGSDGSWRGEPLYLKNGLRSPLLAGAFALFCVLASFGIGNMSQCNSIAQGLYSSFGIPSGIVGTVTAVLLGAVLLGGLKRLSRVTETLVPFMALFYMGGAVVVLWVHRAALPQAFAQICSMAFDMRAGTGGALGYGMMQAVRRVCRAAYFQMKPDWARPSWCMPPQTQGSRVNRGCGRCLRCSSTRL